MGNPGRYSGGYHLTAAQVPESHVPPNTSSKFRNFNKGWTEFLDNVCRSLTKGLVNLQKGQLSQGKPEI